MKNSVLISLVAFIIISDLAKTEDLTTNSPLPQCPNSPIQPTYNQVAAAPYQPITPPQYLQPSTFCSVICTNTPNSPACQSCPQYPSLNIHLYPVTSQYSQYTSTCPPCSQTETPNATDSSLPPTTSTNCPTCPTKIPESTNTNDSTTNEPSTLPQLCPNLPISPTYDSPNPYPVQNPTPTTLPPPPPSNLMQCPPGTILINRICRLIYCGANSIYREGKCLRIECPKGTYWTGSRCKASLEAIIHEITFKSTITTHVDGTGSPIVIKNVNNVTVNSEPPSATDDLEAVPTSCEDCEKDDDDENMKDTTAAAEQPLKCCTVVTPRICKPHIDGDRSKQWHCYSRRYRRCGDICIAPMVLLKPPYPSGTGTGDAAVLPPENHFTECRRSGACAQSNDVHDCSGCMLGRPENCSNYCYRYYCPISHCKYYDQRQFCMEFPGQRGCLEEDGCYEDWCGTI